MKVKEGTPAIAMTGRPSVLIGGDLPPTFRRDIDGSGGLLRIDARVRKTRPPSCQTSMRFKLSIRTRAERSHSDEQYR
jgi:hypothetical protein